MVDNIQKNFGWQCGGSDFEDWHLYKIADEPIGSDQPNHVQRSCEHQPNHLKNPNVRSILNTSKKRLE